ncbi:hypothetical protein VHEMI08886 [[Torrubiella] hemipterigena]|uniref:Cytochrome P450 n=1 Tax=[Torrubiella] hemipterigena TaxID=1531966 RepID=A0A0A1TQJ0_9HYPO|nr:hypothetical protein VHEMI08886 [[Torrubiella] hemipterigena]
MEYFRSNTSNRSTTLDIHTFSSSAWYKAPVYVIIGTAPYLTRLNIQVAVCLAALCAVFVDITIRRVISRSARSTSQQPKYVSVWPYTIPFAGSVVAMASYLSTNNPAAWLRSSRLFNQTTPVQIKAFDNKDYVVIQGPENIKDIFKNSGVCSPSILHEFVLGRVFGMRENALKLYENDTSGYRRTPRAGTNIAPRNRVDFLTFQPLTEFLSGKGMDRFWYRYETNLIQRVHNRQYGQDRWTHVRNLTSLFEGDVSAAIVDALCGPYLLSRHPSFLKNLWMVDQSVDVLFRATPRIFAPKLYAQRDSLIEAVRNWHQYARSTFQIASIDEEGDDPFWGSEIFRNRNYVLSQMDGMDSYARASADFGLIWSSTRNSVVASLWAVIEIFKDPVLLGRVRQEAEKCLTKEEPEQLDIHLLSKNPLMQSIYAEVLRMRAHMFIVRVPQYNNMKVGEWTVGKGKTVISSSTVAHIDETVWNQGKNNQHPLDTFWADRFIKVEGDPESGPRKSNNSQFPAMKASRHRDGTETDTSRNQPCPRTHVEFAIKDVEGSWIPYGGGSRMCPGRHFAKRDIIFTAALFATHFDMEIIGDTENIVEHLRGFGLGTAAIAGEVPVRIRARKPFNITNKIV